MKVITGASRKKKSMSATHDVLSSRRSAPSTPYKNIQYILNTYTILLSGIQLFFLIWRFQQSTFVNMLWPNEIIFPKMRQNMKLKITLLIFHSLTSNLCHAFNVNETDIPITNEIIGGNLASIRNYPFLVSMQYRWRSSKNGHRCCGFLLTPWWVGTAAHCLVDFNRTRKILPIRNFYLIAGTSDVINRDVMHQIRSPASFVPHPEFSWSMLYNDIGLIKVERPFDCRGNIGLAILPNISFNLEPWKRCTVAGWGALNKSRLEMVSDKLMFTELQIIPHELCVWSVGGPFFMNPRGSICTISKDGKKDACQGDSGSPLLCDMPHVSGGFLDSDVSSDWLSVENGRQRKVVGIVSWSWECGQTGIPGMYTDIRNYRKWMHNVVHNSRPSTGIMKYLIYLVFLVHFILADFCC